MHTIPQLIVSVAALDVVGMVGTLPSVLHGVLVALHVDGGTTLNFCCVDCPVAFSVAVCTWDGGGIHERDLIFFA